MPAFIGEVQTGRPFCSFIGCFYYATLWV